MLSCVPARRAPPSHVVAVAYRPGRKKGARAPSPPRSHREGRRAQGRPNRRISASPPPLSRRGQRLPRGPGQDLPQAMSGDRRPRGILRLRLALLHLHLRGAAAFYPPKTSASRVCSPSRRSRSTSTSRCRTSSATPVFREETGYLILAGCSGPRFTTSSRRRRGSSTATSSSPSGAGACCPRLAGIRLPRRRAHGFLSHQVAVGSASTFATSC